MAQQRTSRGTRTSSPGRGTALDPPLLPMQEQPVLATSLLSKKSPSHQRIWSEMILPLKVFHGVIGMFSNKLFLLFGPKVNLASPRSISLGWIWGRGLEGGKVLVLMEETPQTRGEKTQKLKQRGVVYPALLKAPGSWHCVCNSGAQSRLKYNPNVGESRGQLPTSLECLTEN